MASILENNDNLSKKRLYILNLNPDMVLEDVTEFESTPEGRRVTKLDQILLNGNNITMLVPGGEGPEM